MEMNDYINKRRKELGISLDELSEISGVPKGTVSKITAGINKNPKLSTLQALCKALNCTLDDLLVEEKKSIVTANFNCSKSEIQLIKKYRILDEHGIKIINMVLNEEYERCTAIHEEPEPEEVRMIKIKSSVYNKASAGTGFPLDGEEWETIEIPDTPENRQADFVLTISGDSMEPIYHDGDIVLVKYQLNVEIGEIGIFTINNDKAFIKKYGGDRLISLNNEYKDILFSEGDYIRCNGKVIGRI